jgi:wyosine [tRNA(Phe)-imidazoG37] synthetase (radical SAM superfamily)
MPYNKNYTKTIGKGNINMSDFKYVFGPIPSRRLGRSLGISPLPKKTCNYSCIYCQLGRTDKMTNKRQEFYKTEDIIAEFKQYLKDSDKFDIVTVVGEGEPTLAANLGELVVALKALTDKASRSDHKWCIAF